MFVGFSGFLFAILCTADSYLYVTFLVLLFFLFLLAVI